MKIGVVKIPTFGKVDEIGFVVRNVVIEFNGYIAKPGREFYLVFRKRFVVIKEKFDSVFLSKLKSVLFRHLFMNRFFREGKGIRLGWIIRGHGFLCISVFTAPHKDKEGRYQKGTSSMCHVPGIIF